MLELVAGFAMVKASYHLIIFGIQLDQVPNAVRRCLELVRTCHDDLQHLIELRNQNLALIQKDAASLDRTNKIIENAHRGLLEVCNIVEKLRPEAHGGKTQFRSRMEWMFIDSAEFKSQEPLIARQHSAVISELNFLRQIVLFTPMSQALPKAREVDEKSAFDNLCLLDDMLGANQPLSSRAPHSTPPVYGQQNLSINAATIPYAQHPPVESPPPYTYSAEPPESTEAFRGLGTPATSSQPPPLLFTDLKAPSYLSGSGLGPKSSTMFDSPGVSLMFSDIKPSSSPANRPVQPSGIIHNPMLTGTSTTTWRHSGHSATDFQAGSGLYLATQHTQPEHGQSSPLYLTSNSSNNLYANRPNQSVINQNGTVQGEPGTAGQFYLLGGTTSTSTGHNCLLPAGSGGDAANAAATRRVAGQSYGTTTDHAELATENSAPNLLTQPWPPTSYFLGGSGPPVSHTRPFPAELGPISTSISQLNPRTEPQFKRALNAPLIQPMSLLSEDAYPNPTVLSPTTSAVPPIGQSTQAYNTRPIHPEGAFPVMAQSFSTIQPGSSALYTRNSASSMHTQNYLSNDMLARRPSSINSQAPNINPPPQIHGADGPGLIKPWTPNISQSPPQSPPILRAHGDTELNNGHRSRFEARPSEVHIERSDAVPYWMRSVAASSDGSATGAQRHSVGQDGRLLPQSFTTFPRQDSQDPTQPAQNYRQNRESYGLGLVFELPLETHVLPELSDTNGSRLDTKQPDCISSPMPPGFGQTALQYRNSNSYNSPANIELQELSSIRFAPDPAELE